LLGVLTYMIVRPVDESARLGRGMAP